MRTPAITGPLGGGLRTSLVLAVLVAIIGAMAVTAAPARADVSCSDADGNSFDFTRLRLELDEVDGDGTYVLDTADAGVTCQSRSGTGDQGIGANALRVLVDGVAVVTTGGSDSPDFHLSCSDDIGTYGIDIGGTEYTVTSFVMDSVGPSGYSGTCEAFPEPTCEDTQAATCTVPVSLRKVDDADAALAGASFRLDGATDHDCTSDVDGLCDFGAVPPGDYTLTETAAPEGHQLLELSEPVSVVYVEGGSGAVAIELGDYVNTAIPPGCEERQADDCLVPVSLDKVDDQGQGLAGATFVLSDGEDSYDCTSAADGSCDFGLVAPGTYTLDETVVPAGFDASAALPMVDVVISWADGDDVEGVDAIDLGAVVNTPVVLVPGTPAISLVKTAVVGDGEGDGDLVPDGDTGLPTLFFSSGSPGDQTAVYEYTITNTGPVSLYEVTLEDDRLGTILSGDLDVTLEPGDSTTLRAAELFTFADAAGAEDNLVTNTAVTTGSDVEGTEVTDTGDATIQLVAQQSSILIDLVKDVVAGAGDVVVVDGLPTLSWTEAEFDAGAARSITYRFTITNVGPSTLYDVELTDDMLRSLPLVPATDGLTLAPGTSEVVEWEHTVTPDDVFPANPAVVAGVIRAELRNTASVRGSNEARDAFDEDTDDAVLLARAPRTEVLGVVIDAPDVNGAGDLPVAGLGDGGLVLAAMLLLWLGAVALWATDPDGSTR